jgi:hypothetical protein
MHLIEGHPLADGMRAFVPLIHPGAYINLVNGGGPDAQAGMTGKARAFMARSPGRAGSDRVGVLFGGSSYLRFPLGVTQQYNWSLACGFFGSTWPSATRIAASVCAATGSNEAAPSLGHNATNQVSCFTLSSVGGSTVHATGTTLSGATAVRCAGQVTSNVARRLHEELWTDTSNSTSQAANTASTHLFVGGRYDQGTTPGAAWTEAIEYAAIWNRVLARAEFLEFNENPWALVGRNVARKYFFIVRAGSAAQNVSALPFDQTQGWGTPQLIVDRRIDGTAFVNNTTFGTVSSPPAQLDLNIAGTAFANVQAYGTAAVSIGGAAQSINATSFANSQIFGTARLDRTIAGVAFANAQTYGTATLIVARRIDGTAFANVTTFGTARLDLNVAPSALVSSQTFGTAAVTLGAAQNVSPASFVNASTFGTARLDLQLLGVGWGNVQSYGTAQVLKLDQWLEPASIVGVTAFGTARVNYNVFPSGLVNGQSYGTTTVRVDPQVLAEGFTVDHVFGTPVVTGGAAPDVTIVGSQIRVVQARISVR